MAELVAKTFERIAIEVDQNVTLTESQLESLKRSDAANAKRHDRESIWLLSHYDALPLKKEIDALGGVENIYGQPLFHITTSIVPRRSDLGRSYEQIGRYNNTRLAIGTLKPFSFVRPTTLSILIEETRNPETSLHLLLCHRASRFLPKWYIRSPGNEDYKPASVDYRASLALEHFLMHLSRETKFQIMQRPSSKAPAVS